MDGQDLILFFMYPPKFQSVYLVCVPKTKSMYPVMFVLRTISTSALSAAPLPLSLLPLPVPLLKAPLPFALPTLPHNPVHRYGIGVTEVQKADAVRLHGKEPTVRYPLSFRPRPGNKFYDSRIYDGQWKYAPDAKLIRRFFTHLALCHTVTTKSVAKEVMNANLEWDGKVSEIQVCACWGLQVPVCLLVLCAPCRSVQRPICTTPFLPGTDRPLTPP